MIIEFLITLPITLVKIIFSFINIPNLPEELINSITTYINLILDNLTFIGFFIRPTTFLIAFDVVLTLWIFVRLYKITMWIIRKLPFSIE